MSIAGLVLGVLSVVLGIVGFFIIGNALDSISEELDESANSLETTAPQASNEASTATETSAAAPAGVTPFGGTATYENGLRITLSTPQVFEPGESNVGYRQGDVAVRFTVTVENGTSEPFDPVSLFLQARGIETGTQAEQIHDYNDGIVGPSGGAVQPGRDAVYDVAFSVPPGNSNFAVEVSPGLLDERVAFEGPVPPIAPMIMKHSPAYSRDNPS